MHGAQVRRGAVQELVPVRARFFAEPVEPALDGLHDSLRKVCVSNPERDGNREMR